MLQIIEDMSVGQSPAMMEALLVKGAELADKQYADYMEGLEDPFLRATTALMLENTRQWIDRMDESTKVVNIGSFEKFALVA